jgi:YfiH family protein
VTWLRDPLLESRGLRHGFGTRAAADPLEVARPRQVHGALAVDALLCLRELRPEADAVVSVRAGLPIGVVTADCVPILLASRNGAAVAAIHAGWRGLAAGVVEAGVAALVRAGGAPAAELAAAIGPHAGPCCYEVDAPVLEALAARFGRELDRALRPSPRPGRAMLDLGVVTAVALARAGLAAPAVGLSAAVCTVCDPVRFHSHRRDGPRAGRLFHVIEARGLDTPQGPP